MKAVFSSCKNPHFVTITEHIEAALRGAGCDTVFFDDRGFILPGRLRDRFPFLHRYDLSKLNRRLLQEVRSVKPDFFLEAGGHRILPDTVRRMKNMGIKTVLWTIDPPQEFELIESAAVEYDYVFTGGSEAYDLLEDRGIRNLHWLPFACNPEIHRPATVSQGERSAFGCDVCFVGSYYPVRERLFAELSGFHLGIWGPGWNRLSRESPLAGCIRGLHLEPAEWLKIYAASKIVLCQHYRDPDAKYACHQASPRVYEALASGAFLLTDNQRDLLRLFETGRDLVVFEDGEDLKRLVAHYLKEPDLRRDIARQGMNRALMYHTFAHRVEEMLSVAGLR